MPYLFSEENILDVITQEFISDCKKVIKKPWRKIL